MTYGKLFIVDKIWIRFLDDKTYGYHIVICLEYGYVFWMVKHTATVNYL